MDDLPAGIQTPAGNAIVLQRVGSEYTFLIPSRPLGLLWVVFAFNSAVLALFITLGVLYLGYHIAFFSGLPLQPPRPNTAAYTRWFVEVGIGWCAGVGLLVTGFSVIWMPLMTRESVHISGNGITFTKSSPIRQIVRRSNWLNIAEIRLARDKERISQGRLFVTLLGGDEWLIAENCAEPDREWLAAIMETLGRQFSESVGPDSENRA